MSDVHAWLFITCGIAIITCIVVLFVVKPLSQLRRPRQPNVRGPFIRHVEPHASVDCPDASSPRWRCMNCQRTLCRHNLRLYPIQEPIGPRTLDLCRDCHQDMIEDAELRRVGVRDPYYPEPRHLDLTQIMQPGICRHLLDPRTCELCAHDTAVFGTTMSVQHDLRYPPQGGSGLPRRRVDPEPEPEPKPEPSGRRIVL